MLTKLSSIDFGKWALNTSSGFVVAAAAMFVIDSLVVGHRIEKVFTDANAGAIVIFIIGVLVASSILGLLLDSIFITLGRWYAERFWAPLTYEVQFRKIAMTQIGLADNDFKWIYTECKKKLAIDIEKDYLRFTEVAGSTGYTMMVLLGPAAFMFLRLEYDIWYLPSLCVGILIAFCGFVLILTSAESLSKYEMKKTSVVLNDIRKLSTRIDISKIKEKCKKITQYPRKFFIGAAWLSAIIIISTAALLGAHYVGSWRIMEVTKMAKLTLISRVDGSDPGSTVTPTIEITVIKDVVTPGDQAGSMVVVLNDVINQPKSLYLKNSSLTDFVEPKPKWHLNVNLFNTSEVIYGARIYINTYLTFTDSSGDTISADEITQGEWYLPVIVTVDDTDYLLAQVHVIIKMASSDEKTTENSTDA